MKVETPRIARYLVSILIDVEADRCKPGKRRRTSLKDIQKTGAEQEASSIKGRHEDILRRESDVELRVVIARMREATPSNGEQRFGHRCVDAKQRLGRGSKAML
jgi:hypothetical protein